MPISKELKAKWIDALPQYSKGRHSLKRDDGSMCCLGVLADITNSWDASGYTVGGSDEIPYYESDSERMTGDFFSLTLEEMSELATANDEKRDWPVDQIESLSETT